MKSWTASETVRRVAGFNRPQTFHEAVEELRNLLESLRGRGGLRHGLSYVRVSDLVEQAKCEYRFELELLEGLDRVVEERVKILNALIEAALGVKRKLVKLEETCFISLPLAGIVNNIPLVGRPKALIIRGGFITGIVYASIGKKLRLSSLDRVRACAYCLALLYSPLPYHNPVYIHVKALDEPTLSNALFTLKDAVLTGEIPAKGPGWRIFQLVCDVESCLELLQPLLSFWVTGREAVRRRGPWCESCRFRSTCLEG